MKNNEQQTTSTEIGLGDIIYFFKCNKWLIVISGIAGLLIAATYVTNAPKVYEARVLLQMAYFGSNIEQPAALVERLRYPTTYPFAVQESCGMPLNGDIGDYLSGALAPTTMKSLANAIEMKVYSSHLELAEKCASAVVVMIAKQQADLIKDQLSGRHEQLLKYQHALHEEQQKLEKIRETELGNFGYLARLDQLSWLRSRIDALEEESMLSQRRPAKLLVPIGGSNTPVSPKKGKALLLGLLLGLMLGVLYALSRAARNKAF
jgi:hypothetical protein